MGTLDGISFVHLSCDFGHHRQGLSLVHVQQVTDAVAQPLAGLGEPDGMHVALDQFAVGQVERRRIHLAVHHPHGVAEVVLVMRALAGAVGDDERRLSGPAGTAAALRVVGRRGRHVAHVDGVQRRDVDAKFHRG